MGDWKVRASGASTHSSNGQADLKLFSWVISSECRISSVLLNLLYNTRVYLCEIVNCTLVIFVVRRLKSKMNTAKVCCFIYEKIQLIYIVLPLKLTKFLNLKNILSNFSCSIWKLYFTFKNCPTFIQFDLQPTGLLRFLPLKFCVLCDGDNCNAIKPIFK